MNFPGATETDDRGGIGGGVADNLDLPCRRSGCGWIKLDIQRSRLTRIEGKREGDAGHDKTSARDRAGANGHGGRAR